MGLERRGRAGQVDQRSTPVTGEEPTGKPRSKVKSFDISKYLIVEAWRKVEANAGAPGVDGVSVNGFRTDLRGNLYKVWNRMSAGSYRPGAVRAVEIPKDHGAGVRLLGVPNVADRVAQTAAAIVLEEKLEPIFHRDSYGYRPGRSALDAVAATRRRCSAGPRPTYGAPSRCTTTSRRRRTAPRSTRARSTISRSACGRRASRRRTTTRIPITTSCPSRRRTCMAFAASARACGSRTCS